jgi:hypothetical protein
MAPAGETLIAQAVADGSWTKLDGPTALLVPDDLAAALDSLPAARPVWGYGVPSLPLMSCAARHRESRVFHGHACKPLFDLPVLLAYGLSANRIAQPLHGSPRYMHALPMGLVDIAQEWEAFPPSSKRAILEWIALAKRTETRARRVGETARLAAMGQRANEWVPKDSRANQRAPKAKASTRVNKPAAAGAQKRRVAAAGHIEKPGASLAEGRPKRKR